MKTRSRKTEPVRHPGLFTMALILSFVAAATGMAQANAPAAIWRSDTWDVYRHTDRAGSYCFLVASPDSRRPANLRRDPAHLFIAESGLPSPRLEFSVDVGFPLANAGHAVEVGGDRFILSRSGSRLVLRDPYRVTDLVEHFRRETHARMVSVSARGNETVDGYDLRGFTRAYAQFEEKCDP